MEVIWYLHSSIQIWNFLYKCYENGTYSSVELQNDEVERIFSRVSPVLVVTGSHLQTDTGVASAASHFSAFQPVQRSSIGENGHNRVKVL